MKEKEFVFVVQVTRQLSIDILNRFAGAGYAITLLTGVVESQYQPLHENVKVKIFTSYNQKSIYGRLISGLMFCLQCYLTILFRKPKAELILVTTPPFALFLGNHFWRMRRQKYHVLIWDLYPDVLLQAGVIKNESLLYRIWTKLNRSCFGKASSLITLGRKMQDSIKSYTDRKIEVIHGWSDTSFIKPVQGEVNPFVQQHGLEGKFIVMYSGNLGLTHTLAGMVESADRLREHQDIAFVIIGEGGRKPEIAAMAAVRKLNNLLLLPYQNKEMLPYSLGSAHIAWISLAGGAESVSVPSKTFNALAAGSAIIAISNNDSELTTILNQYHCGQVFSETDISSICSFILRLKNETDIWQQYSKRSREASFHFSTENAQRYFEKILAS